MKKNFVSLLAHGLILSTVSIAVMVPAAAGNESPTKQDSTKKQYLIVNYLNNALLGEIPKKISFGVKKISTYQKGNQVFVQVIHNPYTSYSLLVNEISRSGGRVSDVNFQKMFTLNILKGYCRRSLFQMLENNHLAKTLVIRYQDMKVNPVATHRINEKLCSSFMNR